MDLFEISIYKRYQTIIEKTFLSQVHDPVFLQVREPHHVHLSDILDKYDAFCFDGYGTLYNRGSFVYPGALEWFRMLRASGKLVRLVTNAASNTDDVLAAEADARGFDFTAEETISSGSLLKEFVSSRGSFASEAYYIGRATGVNVLATCGISAVENPETPVVAVSSSTATDEMFAHAVEILSRPGATLLVLNSDAWAPNIDGSRIPVSGALSERLRLASGATTYYFGKPFPAIWNRVRASLPEKARVLMIGDTLGTDVYGAYVAGFDSALVIGRNVPAEDLRADEAVLGVRPTYYLNP